MTYKQSSEHDTQHNDDFAEASKKEGRKVLFILLTFFIIVASVNTVFIYNALTTHSGVVVENPYKTGLKFNELIAEAKKRKNEQQQASPSSK